MSGVKTNPESPLPSGWLEELADTADFERSFLKLRGIKHFHVEAWRGHIRAEQLRFDAAWKHFDKAYELAEQAEENIPNLVRQFVLNIWCFQNALAEAPISESFSDLPEAWIPELPEEVLKEYPEVRLVIRLRKESEALLRLHLGQYSDAAELYGQIIEESRGDEEGLSAYSYMGLAACEHNLGFEDQARKNLENCGLMIAMTGRNWNKLKNAAALYAFYRYLEDRAEVENWAAFIERLPCPKTSKDLYLKRASMMLARSTEKTSLILI